MTLAGTLIAISMCTSIMMGQSYRFVSDRELTSDEMEQIYESSNEGRYTLLYARIPHQFLKGGGQREDLDMGPALLLLDTRLGIVYELEVSVFDLAKGDSVDHTFHYEISELFNINKGGTFKMMRTAKDAASNGRKPSRRRR